MKTPDEVRYEDAKVRFGHQMAEALRDYLVSLKALRDTVEEAAEKAQERANEYQARLEERRRQEAENAQ